MRQDWTDKLRDKMDTYSVEPSDKVWAGISSKAGLAGQGSATGKSAIPMWIWRSAAAAAAVMTGALIFVNVNDNVADNYTAYNEAEAPEIVNDSPEILPESSTVQTLTLSENLIEKTPKFKAGPTEKAEHHKASYESAPVMARVQQTEETESIDIDKNYNSGIDEVSDEGIDKEPVTSIDNSDEAISWEEYLRSEPQEKRRADRRGLSIGLGAAGAGSSSSMDKFEPRAVMGSNPLEGEAGTVGWADDRILTSAGTIVFNQPEVNDSYTHKMPVKLGLTARYAFTNSLGIESGLIYSLLQSDIKRGSESTTGAWSSSDQTLHYLGVPLNLTFNFLNSKYVDVYASAGGMMEFGVKGSIKTTDHLHNSMTSTHQNAITPKGLLWSVNATAGVQVNVLPSLGIYVEPGMSHHFKNDRQPRSSYTDKPTNFALGFGLRYTFRK